MSKNLYIKPNTSLKNKTGSWRTVRPITDYNKCVGCQLCAKLCPEACIKMIQTNQGKKPVTDYDYCKGCALCATECPVKAIMMEDEYENKNR